MKQGREVIVATDDAKLRERTNLHKAGQEQMEIKFILTGISELCPKMMERWIIFVTDFILMTLTFLIS